MTDERLEGSEVSIDPVNDGLQNVAESEKEMIPVQSQSQLTSNENCNFI